MFEVQIILMNEFGEFRGQKAYLDEDQYKGLLNVAKGFHATGGFELTLEDGGFIVVPPELVQKSILRIVKKKIDEDVQE